MKVLIDTNVLLCAAFDPQSESFRLFSNSKGLSFYYSELSYNEVVSKIADFSKGFRSTEVKLIKIFEAFIGRFRLLSLPPSPASNIMSSDLDDAAIIDCAVAHQIDIICTYNISDFNDSNLNVATPGSLNKRFCLKESGTSIPYDAMAIYTMNPNTIILSFKPFNPTKIGSIFKTNDGREYYYDEGRLCCSKKSSKVRNYVSIDSKQGIINLWIQSNQKGLVTVNQLTENKSDANNLFSSTFEMRALAIASTQGNALEHCFSLSNSYYKFYGRIAYILAWPSNFKRRSVEKILQAGSIDPVIGSTSINTLFQGALIAKSQLLK
jgi:predicted nucleic acid-binding protein